MKIAMFGRYPDPTRPPDDESLARWQSALADPVGQLPGVRRYVHNQVTGAIDADGINDGARAFDGYATAWFDDEPALLAAIGSPQWAATTAATSELLSPDPALNVVVEPKVIHDEPSGADEFPFKVVWVCRFARQDDRLERRKYWMEHHSGLAMRAPGVRRYVQNHVMGHWGPDGITDGPLPFDGFSECWFDDRAAFERTTATQAWKELDEDAAQLFDLDEIWNGWSGVLQETEYVAPATAIF